MVKRRGRINSQMKHDKRKTNNWTYKSNRIRLNNFFIHKSNFFDQVFNVNHGFSGRKIPSLRWLGAETTYWLGAATTKCIQLFVYASILSMRALWSALLEEKRSLGRGHGSVKDCIRLDFDWRYDKRSSDLSNTTQFLSRLRATSQCYLQWTFFLRAIQEQPLLQFCLLKNSEKSRAACLYISGGHFAPTLAS